MTRVVSLPLTLLNRLTGPIFEKELRVSSRRGRTYALRLGYSILLAAFVLVVWLGEIGSVRNATMASRVTRMAEFGKHLTLMLTWFQFAGTHLIAVVMLSNAVAAEIRQRTMEALLTTPISSLQFVSGKLLSKLLELIFFLALSVPFLALLRIFGGVPPGYVLASLAITLTSLLATGAVTLFFAVRFRRPRSVVIAVVLCTVFAVFSAFAALAWWRVTPGSLASISVLVNPIAMLVEVTRTGLLDPTAAAAVSFSWPSHCMAMLWVTAGLLSVTAKKVRHHVLTRALGAGEKARRAPARRMGSGRSSGAQRGVNFRALGLIRHITGSPLYWKDSQQGRRTLNTVMVVGLGLGLCFSYCVLFDGAYGPGPSLIWYISSYYIVGLGLLASIRTAAMAAASVAKERESRTWPILLTTTLTDRQIIRDKLVAVMRKNLGLWLLLFLDDVAKPLQFTLVESARVPWFPPFGDRYSFMVICLFSTAGYLLLLLGAGFFFSLRLRTSAAAIAAAIAFVLTIYLLQYASTRLTYSIASPANENAWQIAAATQITISIAVQWGLGGIFLWRARRRLRKQLF